MANFNLDYEAGSDAADGTTFANRWKTFNSGATAARIAPGDTIRVMASPDPTSLGVNGTWTDGPQQATTTITSSTNATPIVVTYGGATQHAAGATVILNAHTTNTKANGVWEVGTAGGSSGAWTASLLNADGTNSVGNGTGGPSGTIRGANNLRVMLASAATQNVALCGNQGTKTNWTASANVTASVITTDQKEGGECQQLAVAAGFTTGMAAYFATGTLDLSPYQQLSFKIKQTVGTIGAASSITLRLCSDTAGVTTVDTFNIPALVALNNWIGFTVDKGSALGSAIASIAMDVNTDNGAQTFLLDNIIACKAASSADSLSLTSLIGKNTAGETWCAIQSINGPRVMLDAHPNSRPTTNAQVLQRGYSGTTETVTAYKRETIKVAMAATASASPAEFMVQDSGTDGSNIVFSGGWNRTDMSTQTGETWLDGQNGFGGGVGVSSKNFITFAKINTVRFGSGYAPALGKYLTHTDIHSNNNGSRALNSNQNIALLGNFASMSYNALEASASTYDRSTLSVDKVDGNGSLGLTVSGKSNDITLSYARNNGTYGLQFNENSADSVVRGGAVGGNGTAGIALNGSFNASGTNHLIGTTITDATEVSPLVTYSDARLWSKDHDGSAGNDICFTDGGKISAETSVRHTAADVAWKIDITSTTRTSNYPLDFEIMRLAVAANAQVTVTAWMRRTNTGLTHQLMIKGGQVAGVAADVSSSMTAAADTWEQLTIQFTPTEAGVVSINTRSYGGSTFSGYVDDLGRSQA